MTGNELIVAVKQHVNQLDTASNRTLHTATALLFINKNYKKLARAKFLAKNPQGDQAFQKGQVNTDELNHLVVKDFRYELLNDDGLHRDGNDTYLIIGENDGEGVNVLPNYMFFVRCILTVVDGLDLEADPKHTVYDPNYSTSNTVGVAYDDPFNKSSVLEPIVIWEEGRITFIGGENHIVSEAQVIYLRIPEEVESSDVDNIKMSWTDELIEYTAMDILENWADVQRFQSSAAKKQNIDSV